MIMTFFMIIIKQMAKKKVYGVRNTQVLNAKPDLFVSSASQQRAVSQSDKFSYIERLLAMRQHGCVCVCVCPCGKAVRNIAMDFFGFLL